MAAPKTQQLSYLVADGLCWNWVTGAMPVSNLPSVSPLEHGKIAERLTELAVIISLMGFGLKLDRPLGLRAWGTTCWR